VIVDASAVLEYLLGTDSAGPIREILRGDDLDLHAPALCDVEVVAGLRRARMGRSLSEERADDALIDYLDLPLTRHGHQTLLARVLELRQNFSAYDATYVALAESLGGALLTSDRRLAGAVRTFTQLAVLP